MLRLRRLAVAPFEVAVAFAAVIVGVRGLADPAWTGIVAAVVPGLATGWSIGYALAGVLIVVGLASGRRSVEVVGLTMLAAGVVVQVVAAVIVAGWAVGVIGTLSRTGFAIAALVRVHTIVAGHEIVSVDARTLR